MTAEIRLKDGAQPTTAYPYRLNPRMRGEMDKQVDHQLKAGLISPSTKGSWSSPALLVPKSGNRGFRMVIDYRKVNQQILNEAFRVPNAIDATVSTRDVCRYQCYQYHTFCPRRNARSYIYDKTICFRKKHVPTLMQKFHKG